MCKNNIQHWDRNYIIRLFFKNTEKMVFSIFDVYPPKFGRMNFLGQPRESSHQGASFGTLFAIKSLSKRQVFYDLLQTLFPVFLMFTPHFLIV